MPGDAPRPPDGAAIQFMVLDLLEELLAFSEDPGEMGRFLVKQLQEFMGARAVLLLQHGPDPLAGTTRIVALEPERVREALALEPLLRLAARHPEEPGARFFTRTSDPEDAGFLEALGVESLSLTPLRAGTNRVGSLAVLGHLDLHRSDDVLRLMGLLTPVFTLIQRSAFQFKVQEARGQALAEEYEALWDASPDGILAVGPDGRVQDANAAYLRMSGYALAQLRDLPINALDTSETPEESARHAAQLVRDGAGRFFARHRRADGSTYPVEVSATYVPARGRIISVIRDISEQRAADEALRASEARHRELVEILGEGVSEADPDDTFVMANPEAERIFGVVPGGLVGRSLREFVDEAGWQHVGEQTRRRQGGHTDAYRLPIRRDDGSRRVLDITVTPRMAGEGRFMGSLGVFRDITDELRTQEALRTAQKMESLGNLAGGVAHDMNNVLGAILGMATLQLDLQPEGAPLHRTFQTITKACLRGRNMVKGLLDFARKDVAGQRRPVALGALVQEEIRLLERTLPANIEVQEALDPAAGPILGDPDALGLVLMNLCVNAMDAMPEGGRLTLATHALPSGEVLLTVSDTGTGMAPEVLERALDPFFTTKAHGKGTGLGLSQAYSTVKAHGGSLELRSRPGEGTIVTLRFPAAPAAEPMPSAAGVPPRPLPAEALDLLLVDDDDLVQAAVSSQLEALGHHTRVASSGEAALEILAEGFRPALVLLDLNMPGWGGARTLQKLRDLLPEVPVLLATGRADQRALDLATAHPGVRLLPKPFSLDELRAALAELHTRTGPP